MIKRIPTTMRLTREVRELIKRLAKEYGISQSAVTELAVRHYAKELDKKP